MNNYIINYNLFVQINSICKSEFEFVSWNSTSNRIIISTTHDILWRRRKTTHRPNKMYNLKRTRHQFISQKLPCWVTLDIFKLSVKLSKEKKRKIIEKYFGVQKIKVTLYNFSLHYIKVLFTKIKFYFTISQNCLLEQDKTFTGNIQSIFPVYYFLWF